MAENQENIELKKLVLAQHLSDEDSLICMK